MFSSTDSSDSDFVSWKVRTWPILATLNEGTPARLLPSYDQVPALGLSNPQSRLNRVVFPAPLGPISAVMAPRGISRWSTSTATRPPKRRSTPSAMRIGSTFATPGAAGPLARPVDLARRTPPAGVAGAAVGSAVLSVDKGHLPLVSEDALRPVDHQQHERDPDQGESDGSGLEVGDRQDVRGHQLGEQVPQEREHDPEQHGAEGRAEHRRRTAQQQDGPQEERQRRGVA